MTATKPVVWTHALRDDPDVIGGRLLVLYSLAARMRKDGTGWTLNRQLVADAGVNERTVRRALDWAMGAGYLVRTRRGHRIKDGVTVGSEYRLTLPTQPDTSDGLDVSQPDTRDGLGASHSHSDGETRVDISTTQVDISTTQVDTRAHLRELSLKRPSLQEFRLSAGQSPDGDGRDTAPTGETRDPLQDPNADPFKVGVRLGQLVASGELHDGGEHDEIRDRFGHDTPDERAARAGFDRGRSAQDEPETYQAILDELRPLTATPFNVGKRAAELFHASAPVWRETFECLLHDLFGSDHDAQAQAWVGYHRHGGHRYTNKRCADCGETLDWRPGGSLACSWCPEEL